MHWYQVYTCFCTCRPWVNQALSHHNVPANSSGPWISEPVILTICGLEWTSSHFADSCNVNVAVTAQRRRCLWTLTSPHLSTKLTVEWLQQAGMWMCEIRRRNGRTPLRAPVKMSRHLSLPTASRCLLSARRLCLSGWKLNVLKCLSASFVKAVWIIARLLFAAWKTEGNALAYMHTPAFSLDPSDLMQS